MKRVQFPRGSEATENNIIGPAGQVRVDLTRKALRVHDGLRPGGYALPNEERVRELIASGAQGSVGTLRIVLDEAELTALPPDANSMVLVRQAGFEEAYIWKNGSGDDGSIPSAIDGHWHRLDSAEGFFVRMWRAGLMTIQFNGVEPSVDQPTTVWMNNGVAMLWDGTDYSAATPALYTRYLAAVGQYAVGALVLPNRLLDYATQVTNVNSANESGWYKTSVAATNSPIGGVHPVNVTMLDSNNGMQILHVAGTEGDRFIRYYSTGTWGSWVFVSGQLPARLRPDQTAIASLDTLAASGFYAFNSSTDGKPPNWTSGMVNSLVISSGNRKQIAFNGANADFAVRTYNYATSAWSNWAPFPLSSGGVRVVSRTDSNGDLAFGSLDHPDYIGNDIIDYDHVNPTALATAQEYREKTPGKIYGPAVWDGGDLVPLSPSAGSIPVDFSKGFNFGGAGNEPLSLTNNAILSVTSNVQHNQNGWLWFTCGSAYTYTISYSQSYWTKHDNLFDFPIQINKGDGKQYVVGIAYTIVKDVVLITGYVRYEK